MSRLTKSQRRLRQKETREARQKALAEKAVVQYALGERALVLLGEIARRYHKTEWLRDGTPYGLAVRSLLHEAGYKNIPE